MKGAVPRPRLHARLTQACTDLPLVTVIAGAGFGKTTLLACWAREKAADADVLWIDAGDADTVPGGAVAAVQSALDEPDGQRILIVDNLQAIRSPVSFSALDRLVRQTPSEVTLILASRWEPLLQLNRARAEGRVEEFGADDLTMAPEEIRRVFEASDIPLGDEPLLHVGEVTQGWPVAVRLACIAVGSGGSPADLRGGDGQAGRIIGHYLAGEVFDRLPAAWQDLLQSISILDQVHVDLARDLSGSDLAPTVLEEVAARTGLFTPLPWSPGWFRAHQLVQAYLRSTLQATGPQRVADLHDRTARWFTERGDAASAVPHAIRSGNEETIRAAIEGTGLAALLCSNDQGIRLAREIALAPPEVWPNGRPLVLAVTVLASADPPAALALLDTVDATALRSEEDLRLLAVARCKVLRNQARHVEARAALATASWQGARTTEIALRDSEFALAGVSDESCEQLTRRARSALLLARSVGADRLVVHLQVALSVLALARGEPRDAKEHARGSLARGRRFGPELELELAEASTVCLAASIDLGAATDHETCCAVTQPWPDVGAPVRLLVVGATVELHHRWRAGDPPRPLLDRLDRVLGTVDPTTTDPAIVFAAAHLELRLAEAAQYLQGVQRAVARLPSRAACTAEAHVLRAEEQRVRRDYQRGRGELRPVLRDEVPSFRGSTRLLALVLDGVLAHLDGSSDAGSLQEAVEIAHTTGRRGPFIDLGAAMYETLAARRAALPSHDGFVEDLIEDLRQRDPVPLPDPLTRAEVRVLRHLDSMATLQEIASGLHLSRNTVKTHAAAVYRKLDAASRREAVSRARTLGLL
jgi:LuxR family transcriptional regulator, maltose regulon positive regulatory protein